MTTKLSDDFMQRIADEEVWKELSSEVAWTEELLEKYQDKVDWNEVSENHHIMWTVPMLHKFEKKVNWSKLSHELNEDQLTSAIVDAFKDKWDWHELSGNWDLELTYELIDKYIDRWDWKELISRRGCVSIFDENGITFYERYKEYIPASHLQDTNLWTEIVEQRKTQIMNEILS